MTSTKTFLAVSLLLLSVSTFAQKAPSKNPRSVPVSGSAFIVTKGGDSIKLGLVNVSVYREDELLPQIETVVKFAASSSSSMKENLTRLKDDFTQKTMLKDDLDKELKAASLRKRKAAAEPNYMEFVMEERNADKKFWDALSSANEAEKAYKKALRTNSITLSAPTYISVFTGAVDTQKTDADGKFGFSLRPGKYVATATSERQVGTTTEAYTWMVKFSVVSKPVSFFLSNDNLLDTKCAECVTFLPE